MQGTQDLPVSFFSSWILPLTDLLNVSIHYIHIKHITEDDGDYFLRILAECRTRNILKQRDKIYGLLGLSPTSERERSLHAVQVAVNWKWHWKARCESCSVRSYKPRDRIKSAAN